LPTMTEAKREWLHTHPTCHCGSVATRVRANVVVDSTGTLHTGFVSLCAAHFESTWRMYGEDEQSPRSESR